MSSKVVFLLLNLLSDFLPPPSTMVSPRALWFSSSFVGFLPPSLVSPRVGVIQGVTKRPVPRAGRQAFGSVTGHAIEASWWTNSKRVLGDWWRCRGREGCSRCRPHRWTSGLSLMGLGRGPDDRRVSDERRGDRELDEAAEGFSESHPQ